jgi:hypothetical protein
MTHISPNTFLSNPLPSWLTSDPHQFSGQIISDPSTCMQPFTMKNGTRFCTCVNTCPKLNPNVVSGLTQDLEQTKALLSDVNDAIANAASVLALQTTLVNISGSVSFAVDATTPSTAVDNVIGEIMQVLPRNVGFQLNATVSLHRLLNAMTYG